MVSALRSVTSTDAGRPCTAADIPLCTFVCTQAHQKKIILVGSQKTETGDVKRRNKNQQMGYAQSKNAIAYDANNMPVGERKGDYGYDKAKSTNTKRRLKDIPV